MSHVIIGVRASSHPVVDNVVVVDNCCLFDAAGLSGTMVIICFVLAIKYSR